MNMRQIAAITHPVGHNEQAPAVLQDAGRINGIAWRTCLAVSPDPDRPGAWRWIAAAAHCNGAMRPYPMSHYSRQMVERAASVCMDLLRDVGAGHISMTAAPSGVHGFRAVTPEEAAMIPGRIVTS